MIKPFVVVFDHVTDLSRKAQNWVANIINYTQVHSKKKCLHLYLVATNIYMIRTYLYSNIYTSEVTLLCSRPVTLQCEFQPLARNSCFWRGTQSYCFGEQDGLVDER